MAHSSLDPGSRQHGTNFGLLLTCGKFAVLTLPSLPPSRYLPASGFRYCTLFLKR